MVALPRLLQTRPEKILCASSGVRMQIKIDLNSAAAEEIVEKIKGVLAPSITEKTEKAESPKQAKESTTSSKWERRVHSGIALATLVVVAVPVISMPIKSFIHGNTSTATAATASSAPASSQGFIHPVDDPSDSKFGMRLHPIENVMKLHAGLDYPADIGTPVKATKSGKVTFVGTQGGYGLTVVVDHGGGYSSLYAHLSQITTSVGKEVSQSDVIGKVGSTGHSTGPHLHFEILVNTIPKDPEKYLPKR